MRAAVDRGLRRWGVSRGVSRGALARMLVCAGVVATVLAGWPARLGREKLRAFPDMDFAGEVRALREGGRLGEARVVAEAGARLAGGDARGALLTERARLSEAEQSWLRRLRDAARGALTGEAQTTAGLLGAVTSDMVAIGDVRDLLIQWGKDTAGGESDPLIAKLSALGLATSPLPGADAVPSVLKWARRSGAISDELAVSLVDALREGSTWDRASVAWDVATLVRGASPAGAAREMHSARSAEDLSRMAAMVRHERDGAFALLVSGGEGAAALRRGSAGDAAIREGAIVLAARKGRAGVRFLAERDAGAMLRAHPWAWATRGIAGGRAARGIAQSLVALDPVMAWLGAIAAGWAVLEGAAARKRHVESGERKREGEAK